MKIVFASAVALLVLLIILTRGGMMQDFDSDAWKAAKGNITAQSPRLSLAPAVMRLLNRSMSKSDVIDQLGEPDNASESVLHYEVGMSGVSVDVSFLAVEFEDGMVSDFYISRY